MTQVTNLTLTVDGQAALVRCEAEIEDAKQSVVIGCNALARIRDERLYRATHASFESYCRERWSISASYAIKQQKAAAVIENLKADNCPSLPKNEAQARPLADLPPEQQSEAWRDALEASDGNPTARDVKAAVERITTTQSTPKQYRCPNCHHDEQTEDGDCAKCYEPPKRRGFDELAAGERLFDILDAERSKWPAIKRGEFYEALRTYVEQREAA